jgi:hypothetical protein
VKTERLKSFLSHPLMAVLALVVAPVGLYEWAQQAHEQHVAALERPEFPDPTRAEEGDLGAPQYRVKYVNVPGVQPRDFLSASDGSVPPSEEVIGVVVNGQPRAYLLEATRPLEECVVNDIVGGQPLSVVQSAEMGVIRVLTPRTARKETKNHDAAPASPADLTIVGALEGQLLLSGYGQEFFFDAERIPLVDYPYSRCTWRTWRRAYPNTDLYIGNVKLFFEE